MQDLFRTVVRWAAAVLIGAPAGAFGAESGQAALTVVTGGLILFLGGVFVFASVLASHYALASRMGRTPTTEDRQVVTDLAGRGLFGAVFLGLLGGGLVVGALQPLGQAAVVAAISGVLVLALTVPSWSAHRN